MIGQCAYFVINLHIKRTSVESQSSMDTIVNAANCRNDDRIVVKLLHQSFSNGRIKYHKDCRASYVKTPSPPPIITANNPYDLAFCDLKCTIQTEIIDGNKYHDMSYIFNLYINHLLNHGISNHDANNYKSWKLKSRIITQFGAQIVSSIK